MPKLTIVENPFVTMWFHTETKIVHHQLHQFVYGKEFREFLMTGNDLLRKHQARKWLSDDRANTVLSAEDTEWGKVNWFPAAIAAGWKYWAIVRPKKVLAQMGMERLVAEYAEAGVTAKFTSDPDEAMTWLERQP
jgi:hypothetical protein